MQWTRQCKRTNEQWCGKVMNGGGNEAGEDSSARSDTVHSHQDGRKDVTPPRQGVPRLHRRHCDVLPRPQHRLDCARPPLQHLQGQAALGIMLMLGDSAAEREWERHAWRFLSMTKRQALV